MRRMWKEMQTVVEVLFVGPTRNRRNAWDAATRKKAAEDVRKATEAWRNARRRIAKEAEELSKQEQDVENVVAKKKVAKGSGKKK